MHLSFNSFNRSAFLGVDPDLPGHVAGAAAAGFDFFGIDTNTVSAWEQQGQTLADLSALLDAHGLPLYELVALGITADERAVLEELEQFVRIAEVLRPGAVMSNIMAPPDAALARTFRRCADTLDALDIPLAIEFMPFTPVASIEQTQQLIEASGARNAGLMVDSWHFFRGPDDWKDLEQLRADAITFVQFDDALPMLGNDLMHETLQRRAMPGDGEFELERFSRCLRDLGFDGVVSVEVLSEPLRELPAAEFTRRAYESSRPYWFDGDR